MTNRLPSDHRSSASAPMGRSHGVGIEIESLLTTAELADLLKVSQKQIRRYMDQESLPCIRLGRLVRFSPADVARWLEARRY
jgi:excisionase family DNA binding protein